MNLNIPDLVVLVRHQMYMGSNALSTNSWWLYFGVLEVGSSVALRGF